MGQEDEVLEAVELLDSRKVSPFQIEIGLVLRGEVITFDTLPEIGFSIFPDITVSKNIYGLLMSPGKRFAIIGFLSCRTVTSCIIPAATSYKKQACQD